jgi:hypothetical protein
MGPCLPPRQLVGKCFDGEALEDAPTDRQKP